MAMWAHSHEAITSPGPMATHSPDAYMVRELSLLPTFNRV